MTQIPTLQTERFTLRPLRREDAAALFPTFADEEQMRYWSRAPFSAEEELADWLTDREWDGRSWSVIERATGELVARLVAMPRGQGVAEIGYTVVRHRQREGVASESLAALIAQLLGAEGHRRIFADVDPDNAASNALLARLGFTLEGRLREAWETHIGPRDTLIWGLLAREWRQAE